MGSCLSTEVSSMMHILFCTMSALLGMTHGSAQILDPAQQRYKERYGVWDKSSHSEWSASACDEALDKHRELYPGAGTSSRKQMQATLGNCERCYCLYNSPVFGVRNGWDEDFLPYLRCDNCYDTQHEKFHNHDQTRDIRIEQGLPYFDENHNLQISHGVVAKQLLKHRHEFAVQKCRNKLGDAGSFEYLLNIDDCLEEAGISPQNRDGFYYGGIDMSDYGGKDGFVPNSEGDFGGLGPDFPAFDDLEEGAFDLFDKGVPDLSEELGEDFSFWKK